jgi:GGDEF domain-containing protein
VSVTRASDFADRAETLTELHVVVVRGSEALASTLPEGAALLAERMRESIEALHIPQVGGSGTLSVTASFGVASLPESAGPHRADRRR